MTHEEETAARTMADEVFGRYKNDQRIQTDETRSAFLESLSCWLKQDRFNAAVDAGVDAERSRMREAILAEYEYWLGADDQDDGMVFASAVGAVANLLCVCDDLINPKKRKVANDGDSGFD